MQPPFDKKQLKIGRTQPGYVVRFFYEEVIFMSFNEKLQNLRKENKYSQEELADMLDISRQSVSKWESGQTYPEMDKLLVLCKIFNCSLEELTNDEISKVGREKKNGFNSFVDSFLDLITKTYKMISNMRFKELMRLVFVMGFIGIILLMLLIPLNGFTQTIFEVFRSFMSEDSAFICYKIISFLFETTYYILAILIFIHIFKIAFLDKYEFILKQEKNKDENVEVENAKENKKTDDKKIIVEEKVVKREKEPNYIFFKVLGAIVMFFVKMILLLFSLPFLATVFALCLTMVVIIYLLFKGVFYLSIPVLVIFGLILIIVVLEFISNIIFNRKSKFGRMLIIFLIGIAGLGIGSGILVLEIHNTKYVDLVPPSYVMSIESFDYQFNDKLFFENSWYNYSEVEYIVDNSLKDIKVEVESYKEFNKVHFSKSGDGYYIYSSDVNAENYLQFSDMLISQLSKKEIYNIGMLFEYKITIKGKEVNLNKLKTNLEKHYEEQAEEERCQNEVNELQKEIYNLEYQIIELESEKDILTGDNEVLRDEIEELKSEIQNYKDRIADLLE